MRRSWKAVFTRRAVAEVFFPPFCLLPFFFSYGVSTLVCCDELHFLVQFYNWPGCHNCVVGGAHYLFFFSFTSRQQQRVTLCSLKKKKKGSSICASSNSWPFETSSICLLTPASLRVCGPFDSQFLLLLLSSPLHIYVYIFTYIYMYTYIYKLLFSFFFFYIAPL